MHTRASWSGRPGSVVALVLALVVASGPDQARAWDPGGTRITRQPGTQSDPIVLPSGNIVFSDSEGVGVWVSWTAYRSSLGYFGQAFPSSMQVSQATGTAYAPAAVDYFQNSILVAWSHDHDGRHDSDIFVSRVGPGGAWPTYGQDGIGVCTADSTQSAPCIVADSHNGFYVAWSDLRNAATSGADIYIQHFYDDGTVWHGWPANGIPVCTAAGDQVEPALVSDGAGGAIAIWRDLRAGNSGIYGMRIHADGALDAGWTPGGSAVCIGPGEQTRPAVLPDGNGGAYVACITDELSPDTLVRFARVENDGQVVRGGTPIDTVGVVSDDRYQPVTAISLCRADSGGVYVAWNWSGAVRSGTSVQRIAADGSLPWNAYGLQVGTRPAPGTAPAVLPDGDGGVFVAWSAEGANSVDLRATRIDSTGAFRPYWPSGGVVVSDAVGDQLLPDWRSGAPPGGPIFPYGNGGFIMVWTDTRVPSDVDLYAQDVTRNGVVAPEQPPFCFEYCGQPDFVREARPNPTRGSLLLRAWLPENRVALIDVFDVQGKARGTQRIANLPGGSYMDIPVTLSGLPSGVYFLRYRLEGGPSDAALGTKRVVLLR